MIETRLTEPVLASMVLVFADSVMDARPPNEIITRGASPYMERWMIGRKMHVPTFSGRWNDGSQTTQPPDNTPFPSEVENIFLHRFMRDDREDMHCHPWPNASLVLRGRYNEDTPDGPRVRLPGDIIIRRPDQRHAITGVEVGTVSLFLTGRKCRDWGFWPEVESVPTFVLHSDYRAWLAERREA